MQNEHIINLDFDIEIWEEILNNNKKVFVSHEPFSKITTQGKTINDAIRNLMRALELVFQEDNEMYKKFISRYKNRRFKK